MSWTHVRAEYFLNINAATYTRTDLLRRWLFVPSQVEARNHVECAFLGEGWLGQADKDNVRLEPVVEADPADISQSCGSGASPGDIGFG